MRTVAWWWTAPRTDSKQGASLARIEKLRADRREPDWHPEYPPARAEHLLSALWDAGPALPGLQPLTHSEIAAWQANTGAILQPWEARMLRRLSMAYVTETKRADDPRAQPPWEGTRQDARQLAASELRTSMRGMAAM